MAQQYSDASIEMAKYIKRILLSGGNITMSWGVSDMHPYENGNDIGLSFHVDGFKMTGTVVIVYDEGADYFIIHFIPDGAPERKESVNDICFDELVSVIDSRVEYTGEDYNSRVKKEYNL